MLSHSYRVGSIAGIDFRLHWSLLLGALYIISLQRLKTSTDVVIAVIIVLLLFASITLHEVSHALTARRFGIPTRQIVLIAIGGIAQFERAPSRPLHEFLIAAAGPLVNLLIAGVLALIGWWLDATYGIYWNRMLADYLNAEWPIYSYRVGRAVVQLNLTLAAFNLIPVYPLDGGRLLRAGIRMGFGTERANRIIFAVGLPSALGFILYSASQRYWLDIVVGLLILISVASLQRHTRTWMTNAWWWFTNRGNYAFQRGEYQQALLEYNQMIVRNPRDHVAYYNRGSCYHHLGQHDEAARDYQQAIELNPAYLLSYIAWAHLCLQQHDYQRARAVCDQLMAQQPQDFTWHIGAANISHLAGDTPAAFQLLEGVMASDPHLARPYILRGTIWMTLEELERGAEDFETAMRIDPHDALAYNNRACVHELMGKPAGLRDDYTRAVTLDPTFAHPHDGLGWLALHQGDAAAAVVEFDRALTLDPDIWSIYWSRAVAQLAQKAPESAYRDIVRSLALPQVNSLAHSDTWLRYCALPYLDAFLTCHGWAIEAQPNCAAGYIRRADLLRVAGRYTEAQADYDEALRLLPNDPAAHLGQALIAYAQHDLAQANTSLQLMEAHNESYVLKQRAERLAAVLSNPASAVGTY